MNPATANKRTLVKLSLVAVAMFGFGYALIPLYDLLCDITGINGKTGRTDAVAAAKADVDTSRWVTVEFTGQSTSGLPWEFKPMQHKMKVHPGETVVAMYYARNTSNEVITGQAIPSVVPNRAAPHFKKTECFCFTQQTLQPGESKEMPVRFVVNAKLPQMVETITLSYAFFNTDKVSAKKYGGASLADSDDGHHDHSQHVTHGG